MKNILIYINILIGLCIFYACEDLKFGDDFLEKAPGGDVTIDSIFSKKVMAESFLATGYSSLYYGFPRNFNAVGNRMGMEMLDCLTDLVQGVSASGSGLYYDGAYSAGIEDQTSNTKYGFTKEGNWVGIRNAYIFLENIDRVPDMSAEEKRIRKGEAKMIIATHYSDMLRHFGGLPWIDKAIYPGDDTNYPRLTAAETVNNICSLLDSAADELPWVLADVATDDGRFTRAAALGLKIRVLLFAASPLMNDDIPYMQGEASDKKMVWFGHKDMEWYNRAQAAGEAFFKELNEKGGYQLVNTGNPRADFIKAYHQRGNAEILISTRTVYKSGGLWDQSYYFYQQSSNYGSSSFTLDCVDMFQFADGTNFDWNNPEHAQNPFTTPDGKLNRDPRLYETATIQGDRMQNKRLDIFLGSTAAKNGWLRKVGNMNNWLTGFSLRKFIKERQSGNGYQEVVQWPHLRLAEVYLSYAEILNELNREDEAYIYINSVRARVGMPHVNKNGNLGKDGLREEILLERVREFAHEEVRWFDLIRWKREDVFKKRLRGLNIYCPTDDGKNLRFEIFDLVKDRYWRTNFSPKWYFSAFPPSEINKDYGLVQNPGW